MSTTAPQCPSWCEARTDAEHWLKIADAMPWEAGRVRRFGPLVTVHVGHEVRDDGQEKWWPAEVVIAMHRVETEDGFSQFRTPQALGLASRLAEASAFAITVEGTGAAA